MTAIAWAANEWRPETHLLASILETVDAQRLLFYAAHSKKGASVPKPIEVTRPGDAEKRRTPAVKPNLADIHRRATTGGD